ncbi:MAG: MFS transporter [Alphaproteobacteria bacterium]
MLGTAAVRSLFSRSGGIGRAFSNRNFRIWTAGNVFSLIGTWIQRVAVGWLTWELTRSGAWLGLIAAAEFLPSIFAGPLGGAIADRVDRVKLTRICQILLAFQAVALGVLTLTGQITPELLFLLTLFFGIVTAFGQPSRLSLITVLVRREDISAAVAINSVMWNGARFIGPAIAGGLIVWVGIGWTFLFKAATVLSFLFAITLLTLPPMEQKPRTVSMWREIAEGFAYAFRHPAIGPLLLLLVAGSVFARPFAELLPGFADAVFGRGAEGLALLTSATGLGAVIGGVWLGQRGRLTGQTGISILSTLLLSLGLLAFCATDWFWIGAASLVVAGFGMVVHGVTTQSLIQHACEPAMLGRVLSIYGLSFRAGPALGAIMMGAASEFIGLRIPVAIGAVLCIVVWVWALRRRRAMAAILERSEAGSGTVSAGS